MPTAALTGAGHLAVAAFLIQGRETLLDVQAVNKFTPKTKKKAELSLGQVQQGGMKQQE